MNFKDKTKTKAELDDYYNGKLRLLRRKCEENLVTIDEYWSEVHTLEEMKWVLLDNFVKWLTQKRSKSFQEITKEFHNSHLDDASYEKEVDKKQYLNINELLEELKQKWKYALNVEWKNTMCDKCKPHSKYWIHLADAWSERERMEIVDYILDMDAE